MYLGRRGGLLILTVALWAMTGCGGASVPSDASMGSSQASETTSDASAPMGAVGIADGVTLVPGPGGRLPVKVRWVKEMAAAEGLAVDGGRLLVADEVAVALRLNDGVEVWRVGDPSRNGLEADGSVVIGLDGRDHLRMWSPYNYDLTVDRASGRLISLRAVGGSDLPTDIRPFASPTPAYRLGPDPGRVVARDASGMVAFEIRVREPSFETVGPVSVPGGMALVTSSGHLVVLDYL